MFENDVEENRHFNELEKLHSQLYHCNCGNYELNQHKKICFFCGKTMCNICKGEHGEKQFHEGGMNNLCWKDSSFIIYKGISGKRIVNIDTGHTENLD